MARTQILVNRWGAEQGFGSLFRRRTLPELGRFPFVRTGRLDHCQISQVANEIGFFQRVFDEKPSPLCILFRI